MTRMLIVGYCIGIRSELRLCDEVHFNLTYLWFCRLSLDGRVPDHSTFSKNYHGRFRDSDLLRRLFETVADSSIIGEACPALPSAIAGRTTPLLDLSHRRGWSVPSSRPSLRPPRTIAGVLLRVVRQALKTAT